MMLSGADFAHLKWSLLTLLFVLAGGGASIAASGSFITRVQGERQDAQRRLAAARSQLAAAVEDRENMKAYTSGYGELLKRNIVGGDRRLEWIEDLEKIRKRTLVLDFDYAIAPQHSYTLPAKLDSGNFEPNVSDMSLHFDLLHEGQLMDFFDALRTGANGRFILDRCVLERDAGSHGPAQLKAECAGGWLTLQRKNEK